jgi:hypothetical protein
MADIVYNIVEETLQYNLIETIYQYDTTGIVGEFEVLEYVNLAGFPATGKIKTIYIAKDTNLLYRWTGTAYQQVGGSESGNLSELGDVDLTKSKTTPINADSVLLQDTEDSSIWKKLTWSNIKNTLKTYFDSFYQATLVSGTNIKTIDGNSVLGSGDLTITSGIGGSIASGQVAFGGGTNTISGSNSFTWDNTNGRLGIGTTTPDKLLSIHTNGSAQFDLRGVFNSGFFNTFSFQRARGTLSSPTSPQANDEIGGFAWGGWNGSLWTGSRAGIFGVADGDWTGGTNPVRLIFSTTTTESQLFERMRITSTGLIGINNTSPTAQLDITNALATQPVLRLTGVSGQSASYRQTLTNAGAVVEEITSLGTFNLIKPAETGRETILKATVSDDSSSQFGIANGTTNDTFFMPTFYGFANYNTTNVISMKFAGYILAAKDVASDIATINFQTYITSSSTDPNNGTGSKIVNKPLLSVLNYLDKVLLISPNGSQAIGSNRTSLATAQLDVINALNTQPIAKFTGTTSNTLTINNDGSISPVSLADSSAPNNSSYFSSTTSRFTYKNSSGVLNSFSNANTGDETTSTIKTKLGSASTSADGYLTSTDWNNFNSSSKYYVSRWGADITDTTGASLQTALNNMINAGLHTAILDAGTWYTDQTITLKLSLYGLGKNTSIIRANNGLNDDVILVEGFTGGKGSYRTYKDFGVFGNAQYNTTGSCIKVSSPTIANFQADFLIFDSLFLESPKDHGIEIADPNNIIIAPRIINCDIIGDPVHSIGDGIVLDNNTYDAFIHNCDIGYFKVGSGIKINGGRGDQISNCKSWQNLYGYNLIATNRTQIVNCLSDYSGAHGLRIENCNDHLLFTNCTFRKSSANNNNLFESIAIFNSNDIQFYNCACFGDNGTDPTFPNNPSFVWFIATGCSNIRAKGMRYDDHISGYANVGTVTNLDIYDQGQVKVNSSGNIELASALHLARLDDSSAPNDTTYYSTTQSKLVYKDSGGTVNNLY